MNRKELAKLIHAKGNDIAGIQLAVMEKMTMEEYLELKMEELENLRRRYNEGDYEPDESE